MMQPIYKFCSGDNLWFTSDTHFGHENIIRFCGRPFANVEEMDEELIRRWNETVPEDGIVFHLGDFANGGSKLWNDILFQLKGRKHLILGNHDMKPIRQGYMCHFELVTQQMTIQVGGQTIILNHYPFLCYGGAYRNVWQLFGHVHSGPFSHTGLDHSRLNMLFPLQYDVGVDNNDFRPISFADVKAKIEAQVEAARSAAGLKDISNGEQKRRILFLDPAVMPQTSSQKKAFFRLKNHFTDIIEITADSEAGLAEAIGRRLSSLCGESRYVYVGTMARQDFREVLVDVASGITEETVDRAIAAAL